MIPKLPTPSVSAFPSLTRRSRKPSIAQLVLAQIIMLRRGIAEKNAILHHGVWLKSAADAYVVRGKTPVTVGLGHIGTQIGVSAEQMANH
ncbi:MAG: hypothetical protein H7255_18615 [Ramlibacter sp.]|nr:hypothetical protein [Ramlibacter sp.]